MTLDALTQQHHAALLASCWREFKCLDVSKPRIEGVFGKEDFEHPRNRCGMLEVSCDVHGHRLHLTGPRMIPLVHGYHRMGPNSDADAPRPAYHIGGGTIKGVGMPDLSLIRLPPPHADAQTTRLLLAQPLAVAAVLGMGALAAICLGFPSAPAALHWILVAACAAHVGEAAFALYIAAAELRLSLWAASRWAAVVALVGFPCLRWLLRLRPRRTRPKLP